MAHVVYCSLLNILAFHRREAPAYIWSTLLTAFELGFSGVEKDNGGLNTQYQTQCQALALGLPV